MKTPQTPHLDDANAERARSRFVECIVELQSKIDKLYAELAKHGITVPP